MTTSPPGFGKKGYGADRASDQVAIRWSWPSDIRSVSERFLVAVETDGPEYAGLLGSRARDRLRVEQLELLGWRPVRVWTTDLYRDPAREVARIVAAVRDARRPSRSDEDTPSEDHRRARMPQATDPSVVAPAHVARSSNPRASEAAGDDDGGCAAAPSRRATTRTVAGENPPTKAAHELWLQEQRPPHWE